VGVDLDPAGGMSDIGRIILDARVFGLLARIADPRRLATRPGRRLARKRG
jgi:hypothetical protein